MRILLRGLGEYAGVRRVWLPLLLVVLLLPLLALAMPLLEKRLIDDVLLQHRTGLLLQTVALYGVVWMLLTVLGLVRSTLQVYLGLHATRQLRQRLFDHFGALSLAFSHREHSARTTALFHNDVPMVAGLLVSIIVPTLGTLVGLAVGIALMFRLSPQLALAAGLAPPVIGAAATVLTRPLRPMSRRVQEKAAELSERLDEHLAGIREVAAFGQERAQGARFAATLGEWLHLRLRLVLVDGTLGLGQSVFSLAVTLLILGYGGYLVLHGLTTVGTLVAMRALFGQTFTPATQLFGTIKDMQTSLAAAERVYAYLDEQPRAAEQPGAQPPRRVEGTVRFERVSFAYQPDQPVLREVSLDARPGELIALVGPSGAGKSTLASLIARFYDPAEGRVLLDGTDLRELTLHGLREQIAIVFQDTFLFAATIRENIAFGRAGATEAEIVAAARAANAWEFIERLPKGLDTQVGQRGVRLSEGQKQRLAVARALLRDPRILILDEPTSALDARSEHLLQAALDNLVRGRTTFVIAHRLATVQRADRILVVDGGRIVEQGTHAELLQRRGLYRELYALQFGPPPQAAPVAAPAVVVPSLN